MRDTHFGYVLLLALSAFAFVQNRFVMLFLVLVYVMQWKGLFRVLGPREDDSTIVLEFQWLFFFINSQQVSGGVQASGTSTLANVFLPSTKSVCSKTAHKMYEIVVNRQLKFIYKQNNIAERRKKRIILFKDAARSTHRRAI
jgi:hypothetical protein